MPLDEGKDDMCRQGHGELRVLNTIGQEAREGWTLKGESEIQCASPFCAYNTCSCKG